ncbi:hypothetical protein HK098_003166 [Nowakowskiella sp. JEL0407]|nr:hypothetical protein HK098_003166 [Nowakowskiella sp. JEL0407]
MVNYDKWNKIEVSDSEDESAEEKFRPQAIVPASRSCKIITVPWDSFSEAARWALDRHGMSYLDISIPWGLHIFESLKYSDPIPKRQHTSVPILINDKGEIYKRSITDIFMYLFANSFSGHFRIYTPPTSLTLQQFFDIHLAPHAKTIFLSEILTGKKLASKYFIKNIHLPTHKSIYEILWPVLRLYFLFEIGGWKSVLFGIPKQSVTDAWENLYRVFNIVDDILSGIDRTKLLEEIEKDGDFNSNDLQNLLTSTKWESKKPGAINKYLCGSSMTAADISFASHASLVLLPSKSEGKYMTIDYPGLGEFSIEMQKKVIELRETKAGKFAMRMYKSERKFSEFRKLESKFEKRVNPWWTKNNNMKKILGVGVVGVCLLFAISFLIKSLFLAWLVVCGVFVLGVGGGWTYFVAGDGEKVKIFKQIWFIVSGKSLESDSNIELDGDGKGKEKKNIDDVFPPLKKKI